MLRRLRLSFFSPLIPLLKLWQLTSALMLVCFSLTISTPVSITATSSNAHSSHTKALYDEVKNLQNQLLVVQEKIEQHFPLADSSHIKNPKDSKTESSSLPQTAGMTMSVIAQYVDQLSYQLQQRLLTMWDHGVMAWHQLWYHHWRTNVPHALFVALGVCFFITLTGMIWSHFWLDRVFLDFSLKSLRSWRQFVRLNYALLQPLPIYALLALVMYWGLSSGLDWPPFVPLWTKQSWACLPFHGYVITAMWTWSSLLWSSYMPNPSFLILAQQSLLHPLRWFRASIISYALMTLGIPLIVLITPTLTEQVAMLCTLLDGGALLGAICLYRGLHGLKHEVRGSPHVLAVLTRVRHGLLIFSLGWFVARSSILILITPCLWTLLGHLSLRAFRHWLRRRWNHNIWSLWPRWMRGWLQSKEWVSHITTLLAYGGLTLIWYTYVEQWVGERHWAILQSLRLFMFSGLFNSLIIIFFALIIIKLGDRVLRYYVEEKYSSDTIENNFLASRLKTLMAMLTSLLRVIVWIPAIGLIVSQFGNVNLSTWVTSIGAASFGLTFGLQHIVRDFIAGFFIILENNLMVGDEVDVDLRTGKVEAITIRTLKIRTDQGMLLTIPFGSIQVIGNKNRQFSAIVLNISVGYNENPEKVQSLIEKTFAMVKRAPIFGRRIIGPLEFRGITEVTSFSMIFQVKITTAPNMQDSIRRAFTRQLKLAFDEAGVVVPVPPISTARAIPSLTNTILS